MSSKSVIQRKKIMKRKKSSIEVIEILSSSDEEEQKESEESKPSTLSVEIPGRPTPQKRFHGKSGQVFNGCIRETNNFKKIMIETLNRKYGENIKLPFFIGNTPLSMKVMFFFERPKYHLNRRNEVKEAFKSQWCTKKIDVDNCCKFVLDACSTICYEDDKQIVELHAYKKWDKNNNSNGRTIVQIEEIIELVN